MVDVVNINDKAAEFRANAEACGLSPTRGIQMDAYVTNSINGNGTSKFDNLTKIMSAQDAYCMKIPGSVDEPSGAVSKWFGQLKKDFHQAVDGIATNAKELGAKATGLTMDDVKNTASDLSKAPAQIVEQTQRGFADYSGLNRRP